MRKLINTVLIMTFLISSLLGIMSTTLPIVNAYTPHDPIRINLNADFPGFASSGNGSYDNPWIIENYEINGAGKGYCIYIGNTTEHFIIRNCKLIEASGTVGLVYYYNIGLYLHNAQNGIIYNCNISSNEGTGIYFGGPIINNVNVENCVVDHNGGYGISLVYANYNTIVNTSISHNEGYGLMLTFGNGNTIDNCTINFNKAHSGIGMSLSLLTTISNNSIISNEGEGIRLDNNANYTEVSYNTIKSNTRSGLLISSSLNNTVSNNIIMDNREGIHLLQSSENNDIKNNTISDNNGVGIFLQEANDNIIQYNIVNDTANNVGISISDSINNVVHHNNLLFNKFQAMDSGGGVNNWDDGYPSGGNYWLDYAGIDEFSGPNQDQLGSDGIGDSPYDNITFTTGMDNYPLMSPTIDLWPPNSVIEEMPFWLGLGQLTIVAEADDVGQGIENVTLWYQHSTDNVYYSSWILFGTDTVAPWSWDFDFPQGEGYYGFQTVANDKVYNKEEGPSFCQWFCYYDPVPPAVYAGRDQVAEVGTLIHFNDTNVTDNIEIDNFRWNFTYNGTQTNMYGEAPQFLFDIAGNYTVNLNVTDIAGNWAMDSVNIDIYPIDTDSDGIPDIEDDDDDNDGYLDEWEVFLGTDPTDFDDTPLDTDGDGEPNGDANNTQPWMDTDDDDDSVLDVDDPAPLDSAVYQRETPGFGYELIIFAAMIACILFRKKRK